MADNAIAREPLKKQDSSCEILEFLPPPAWHLDKAIIA